MWTVFYALPDQTTVHICVSMWCVTAFAIFRQIFQEHFGRYIVDDNPK